MDTRDWVQIPVPAHISRESSDKPPTSMPQFPHPYNENDDNTFLLRVVTSLQETMEVNAPHRK